MICNFMIFSESVGSGASLSATKGVNQIIVWFTSFFYTLFYILGCKIGYLSFHLYYNWAFINKLTNKSTLKN